MKCCLCESEIIGFGNNARPLAKNVCCDECNENKVVPFRLRKMNQERKTIVRDR